MIERFLQLSLQALNRDAENFRIMGALYEEHEEPKDGSSSPSCSIVVLRSPLFEPMSSAIKARCRGTEVEYVPVADVPGGADLISSMQSIVGLATRVEDATASFSLPKKVAVKLPVGWLIVDAYVASLYPTDGHPRSVASLAWLIKQGLPKLRLYVRSEQGFISLAETQSQEDIANSTWTNE